jgi:hypothetical protein
MKKHSDSQYARGEMTVREAGLKGGGAAEKSASNNSAPWATRPSAARVAGACAN